MAGIGLVWEFPPTTPMEIMSGQQRTIRFDLNISKQHVYLHKWIFYSILVYLCSMNYAISFQSGGASMSILCIWSTYVWRAIHNGSTLLRPVRLWSLASLAVERRWYYRSSMHRAARILAKTPEVACTGLSLYSAGSDMSIVCWLSRF